MAGNVGGTLPAFNFTAFPLPTYAGRRSLKLRGGALCRDGSGAVCPPNQKKLRNGRLIFNLRRAAVGRFCQILRVAFFSHSSGFVAARIFLRPLRIIGKRAGAIEFRAVIHLFVRALAIGGFCGNLGGAKLTAIATGAPRAVFRRRI